MAEASAQVKKSTPRTKASRKPAGRKRREIPEAQRLLVWVRSGGCCALCGRYLLEGPITRRPFALGQLAHIVGQGTGSGSPRGQDPMSAADRDKADNLILVCGNDHPDIDRAGSLDVITVEWLRKAKADHEAHVRNLMGIGRSNRTAVLRLIGNVYGETVQVDAALAADAVLKEHRFPYFPLSINQEIEIDLRALPGEPEGDAAYWAAATRVIDLVVDGKVRDAIAHDQVSHLSVFGFARLPLLAYLGTKLGDAIAVDLYQRHRETERWDWQAGPADQFDMAIAPSLAGEMCLLLNVSGSIAVDQLPAELAGMPRITLTRRGGAAIDALRSRESLSAFEASMREIHEALEQAGKPVQTLHIVAAVPITAAIVIGRIHQQGLHPRLALYVRNGQTYAKALEIE